MTPSPNSPKPCGSDPNFAEAQSKLALVFIKQGKIAEAIPHFAETVRLLPNDAEARFNLGLALLDSHRPAEAAVQFSEELRLTPDETKAHYRLAQALQQQNQLAGAVRALPRRRCGSHRNSPKRKPRSTKSFPPIQI